MPKVCLVLKAAARCNALRPWRKLLANYRQNLKTFGQYEKLKTLPENLDGLGPWTELPSHLR